jgi:hypothetical protein
MATSKPDLQVHAARLRAIATDLLGMDSDSADVPALLAGAAALEAVEGAKVALDKSQPFVAHREDDMEVCKDWCPRCRIEAALAKLEAL